MQGVYCKRGRLQAVHAALTFAFLITVMAAADNSQAALDAIRSLSDSGILFIASAGNEARDNDRFPVYPSGHNVPNIVSVGLVEVSAGCLRAGSRIMVDALLT